MYVIAEKMCVTEKKIAGTSAKMFAIEEKMCEIAAKTLEIEEKTDVTKEKMSETGVRIGEITEEGQIMAEDQDEAETIILPDHAVDKDIVKEEISVDLAVGQKVDKDIVKEEISVDLADQAKEKIRISREVRIKELGITEKVLAEEKARVLPIEIKEEVDLEAEAIKEAAVAEDQKDRII